MPVVEFIGASGVGKTWLVQKVLERLPRHTWAPIGALAPQDPAAMPANWRSPSTAYEDLLSEKRAYFETIDLPEAVRENALRFSRFVVWREQMVALRFPDRLILADESVLQHFLHSLAGLYAKDPRVAASLLGFRHAVFVHDDAKDIAMRFIARQKAGHWPHVLDHVKESGIEAKAADYQSVMQTLNVFVESCGGICLRVNRQDGTDACVEAIMAFLAETEALNQPIDTP